MTDTIEKLNDTLTNMLNRDVNLIDWTSQPAPGKWSKKQIIGHLIDSAQINLQRFVRCTYQENFKLTYDQVEWVEAQRYQQADAEELLNLWNLLNRQIIRVWENYPEDRLMIKCDNSKTTESPHTVEWLAADYVEHMRHHLKQFD
ncbi:MAG TPA: DinB family protein [Mucilaginibacter sp.]